MLRALILLLSAFPILAQIPIGGVPNGGLVPRYQIFDTDTLSSGGEFLSVQQTTNGPRVQAVWGSVYCSAACTVEFYHNATLAGSHPPIQAVYGGPAQAIAWLGTPLTPPGTIGAVFQLAAGTMQAFDLTEFVLGPGAGTGSSLSMGVAGIGASTKFELIVEWIEVQ